MKANEGLARRALTASQLMIGDLVRVSKDVCIKKGTIVEIRGIDADNALPERGLKGCATCVPINDPYHMSGGVWVDYLEPIRITEEMLVRWGFRHDGTGAYILEQRRGVHDPSDKPYYHIKVTPPQPDNDDWWSSEDTGFEVDCDNGDMLLADQKDTYYHVLQHLLRLAKLEDVVELKLED